jgi:hypothetical protein
LTGASSINEEVAVHRRGLQAHSRCPNARKRRKLGDGLFPKLLAGFDF